MQHEKLRFYANVVSVLFRCRTRQNKIQEQNNFLTNESSSSCLKVNSVYASLAD